MNLLRRASLGASLLAALPRLGITLTENQDPLAALEARLSQASNAAVQPTAEQINTAAVALLTSAGLELGEGQTVAQALAAYNTELEAAEQQVTTLTAQAATNSHAAAQLSFYTAALSAVGIKPTASDAQAGVTQADIQASLEARISTRAAEQLSQHGTPAVAAEPTTDNSKPAQRKSTVIGSDRVRDYFAAKAKG